MPKTYCSMISLFWRVYVWCSRQLAPPPKQYVEDVKSRKETISRLPKEERLVKEKELENVCTSLFGLAIKVRHPDQIRAYNNAAGRGHKNQCVVYNSV